MLKVLKVAASQLFLLWGQRLNVTCVLMQTTIGLTNNFHEKKKKKKKKDAYISSSQKVSKSSNRRRYNKVLEIGHVFML